MLRMGRIGAYVDAKQVIVVSQLTVYSFVPAFPLGPDDSIYSLRFGSGVPVNTCAAKRQLG